VSLILDPLAHEFMWRALIVAVVVGAACAVLSCFLVLKGWSLMGDAVSHAVLPGIVLAFLGGVPLKLGALAAGLGCALATGYIRRNSRLREDAVLAIVFAGMFATGLVLFVKVDTDQHLNHILFGNVLGVSWAEVIETAAVAGPVAVLAALFRRDLFLVCFDPGHARAIGLPAGRLEMVLLAGLALVIVAALAAAGIVLVVAMLIAPGAIGFVATRRFGAMMTVAVAVSVTASVVGVLASFHLDIATAPLIVVLQGLAFVPAVLLSPRGRPVWRARA
jgi:manganese/iron transport system permease protein